MGNSMSSQSLKNLTIFNFAQILHVCLFTSTRETTVKIFRKIGKVFFELRNSQKLKFYPKNRA